MGLQLVVQVTGKHAQDKLKDGYTSDNATKGRIAPGVRVSPRLEE
ncbi:hypothetical protein SDD30_07260 [Moorella naiadis]